MSTDRESPNPFESPRTVATGSAKEPPRELGPQLRDLKHQTIGFATMTLTGIVAALVAFGMGWFALETHWSVPLDAILTIVGILAVVLGVAGALMAFVCAIHTIVSALKFAFLWYIGRGPAKENDV